MSVRRVLLWLALLTVVIAQGCGTATYDERFQQRADELRYSEDHYDQ